MAVNNIIGRTITLSAEYQPVSDAYLNASVTLENPTANTCYFQGDTGDDVPLEPGEWHEFQNIDLASLRVKGTPGDVVKVIGGSW